MSSTEDNPRPERSGAVEVLHPDGTMTVMRNGTNVVCRATTQVSKLIDEAEGLSESLPWRDLVARETAARSVAATNGLSVEERRAILEHIAKTPVIDFRQSLPTPLVEFVEPPDFEEVSETGLPREWLCATTIRTDRGAILDSSAAVFASEQERVNAVRRIAGTECLSMERRRELADRVARSPITTST